jgi:CheY-like chemotaxis protein
MAIGLGNDRWSKIKTLALEPDILAPYQYLKIRRRTEPAAPEKALMFAVLADAIETYQKFAAAKSSRGKTLFREVEAWLWNEQSDAVFSFLNICEVLQLDPGSLRRRLLQCGHASAQTKIQLRLGASRTMRPISRLRRELGSNHLPIAVR